ncbi:MAG TPA: J domain-containing protein [Candidatus Dormibacteraeota bacterium]
MRFSDGVDDEQLYALLGVAMTASAADLKSGRRQQAQRWHPDRNADRGAQARMAAINNAYRVLSDPVRRREYDESILSAWQRGDGASGTAPQPQPWAETKSANGRTAPRGKRPSATAPGTVTSANYLREQGFSVVDNRATGGVLWVVATPEVEPILERLRKQGLEFEYSPTGGMATGNKAAWWTRAWG